LSDTRLSRRRWAILLLILPVLAAVQLTFLRMDDGGTPTETDRAIAPTYTVSGAEIMRFDITGDPVLHATASSVTYFDDQSAQASTLHLDTLRGGAVAWQLDSPTGSMPAHQHRYLLEGPVHVVGRWPDTGETVAVDGTEVWVDPETHEFFSATPVALHSASRNGDAVGMRADWQTHRLQLLRDVRMSYVVAH